MGTVAIATPELHRKGVRGTKRAVTAVVTGSASYATGGDTIPKAALGLRHIDDIHVEAGRSFSTNSGISVRLAGTPATPLLQYYDAQGTQVTNATSLATRIITMTFLGT